MIIMILQCGCVENTDSTQLNNNSVQENLSFNNSAYTPQVADTPVEIATITPEKKSSNVQSVYQDLEWKENVQKQYVVIYDDWERIRSNINDVHVGEKEDYKTLALDAKRAKEESMLFNVSNNYTKVKLDWELLLDQFEHFGNVVTGSRTQQARELAYDIDKQVKKTDNELSELGIIVFKSED